MSKYVKKPRISVIIAAYNEEKYIGKCISSLTQQTLLPYEIIVVDDGSTDKTFKIASQFAKTHKKHNIRVFKRPHLEQAQARHFGVKKTKGEILFFPDGDMYFDKKYLENLIKPIIQKGEIATLTKEEYIANPENIWSQCWSINSYLPFTHRLPENLPDSTDNFRMITRREFLKAGGFSETGYTIDVTVLRKLGRSTGGICAPGAISYHYNPANLSKVFASARRMGREKGLTYNMRNFIIYSFPNSLRRGIFESIKFKKPQFLIFKVVFDLGVTIGFFDGLMGKRFAKS